MATALCALMIVPAVALAGNKIVHSGNLVGKPASSVKLKVTKKGGDIKKVSGFKADGVNLRCPKRNRSFKFSITGSIEVHANNRFKARVPNVDDPDEKVRVTGRVMKGGRKVVGNIKTTQLTIDGKKCDVPKQRYATKKVR